MQPDTFFGDNTQTYFNTYMYLEINTALSNVFSGYEDVSIEKNMCVLQMFYSTTLISTATAYEFSITSPELW